jgi:uncharacterized protein YjbI with pentapeptide repeats
MNKEEKNSNKCPICGRLTHKESKYCIFHASAEEKTEEEFKKALKGYINKIKKVDGNYNFSKFIFVGSILFKEDFDIEIFKNASFFEAIFEGDVNFTGINFDGDTYFIGTIFKGKTFFIGVTFEGSSVFIKTTFNGDANFITTTFNGEADFKSTNFESFTHFEFATFNGAADFREATFKMNTVFKQTSFMGIADFEDVKFNGHTTKFTRTTFAGNANYFVVKFKGNADFGETIFKHDANFEEATFENDVDFRCKYLFKNLNFSKIETLPGKKLFIRLQNKESIISFNRAHLENTYLDIDLVEGVSIDFTDALLKNTKIVKSRIENHILQEKEKEFSKAKEIYLLLKNNFHSIGRYDDESWAFKKEKDMERKSICHFKSLHKWLGTCFLNIIYGYGEKPWNVIFSALVIIIFFALLFSGFLKSNVVRNFPDSFYFSLITFTTLGYGDFRPLEGWGRILAGSEAFIGAFMMALFVYTFARRTGGR